MFFVCVYFFTITFYYFCNHIKKQKQETPKPTNQSRSEKYLGNKYPEKMSRKYFYGNKKDERM